MLFHLLIGLHLPGGVGWIQFVQLGLDDLPEFSLLTRSYKKIMLEVKLTDPHLSPLADSPMEFSMVDIATWPALTASRSTPAEQEDSELIVKPRGWKSGLRSVRLEVRASCRSCRDLPPSEHQK